MRETKRLVIVDLLFALVVLAVMIILGGCETPRVTVTADKVEEVGIQLAWGERHYAVKGTAGRAAELEVDKRTLGVVGGALGGAAIGAATGNVAAGAVVGTIAGSIGAALDGRSDGATTGTAAVVKAAE